MRTTAERLQAKIIIIIIIIQNAPSKVIDHRPSGPALTISIGSDLAGRALTLRSMQDARDQSLAHLVRSHLFRVIQCRIMMQRARCCSKDKVHSCKL